MLRAGPVPLQAKATAIASTLRGWWTDHHVAFLRIAVAILSACAALRLGEGFWRLLSPTSPTGANDLRFRYDEVQPWFAGQPVYLEMWHAVYPPASYPMLWPFLGWLDFTAARWLWAATSVLLLVWLTGMLVKESGAATALERRLAAVLFLSMNATGLTVGNGQFTLHVLAPVLASMRLLRQGPGGWARDLVVAFLLLITMVKPNDSMPFFWLALFLTDSLRPFLLVGVGYVALTLLAASFQPVSLSTLLAQWLANASNVAGSYGCANLNTWLTALGLQRWNFPVSFAALIALGVWTYRHRDGDFWILLGVAGVVTRLWTYHFSYDDALIALPVIALFRLATRGSSTDKGTFLAGLLLAPCTVVMLTPETVRRLWPLLFSLTHSLVWIAVLIFLLGRVRRRPT